MKKNDFKPSKTSGGTYTDQRTAVRAATVPPSSCKGAAKPTTIFTVLEPKFDHFFENGAPENGLKNHLHDFFLTWDFFSDQLLDRSLR